jgi:hypothetical protein
MAFPRAHGSLADEFGDYEPLFARRPTYNSHDVCSSGISPEDQQVLESAFFSNSHPSAGDINHLTYTHLDAGTYHLSEQSDSVNAPSSLQLPGNITAQDDGLLFNSGGWVGSGHEPVADSVYFRNANSSAEFNTEEHLETHSYYTPSFSQDIDSTSSQNILREEIASNDLLKVPSAGAPWYPGSRVRPSSVLRIFIADEFSSSINKANPLMSHTTFPGLVASLTASTSRRKPLTITLRRLLFPVTYRHTLQPPMPEAQRGRVKAMHLPHHRKARPKYAIIVVHCLQDDTAEAIVPDTSVSDMPETPRDRARTACAASARKISTARTPDASTNGRSISSRTPNHALDDWVQDPSATFHTKVHMIPLATKGH